MATDPTTTMTPVNSSNIDSIGYDDPTNRLWVLFRSGKLYQYADVPSKVYHQLMAAESHGVFFNEHIRTHYEFTPVDTPAMTSAGAFSCWDLLTEADKTEAVETLAQSLQEIIAEVVGTPVTLSERTYRRVFPAWDDLPPGDKEDRRAQARLLLTRYTIHPRVSA